MTWIEWVPAATVIVTPFSKTRIKWPKVHQARKLMSNWYLKLMKSIDYFTDGHKITCTETKLWKVRKETKKEYNSPCLRDWQVFSLSKLGPELKSDNRLVWILVLACDHLFEIERVFKLATTKNFLAVQQV